MAKTYFRLYLTIIIFLHIFISPAISDDKCLSETETTNLDIAKDLKPGVVGRDWYVDGVNGDDNRGDGTSFKTAWKTIGKVFDYYTGRPAPGDCIRIAAGLYRERISIRASGTAENRILIGPYGNGEVIIDASDKIEGWELYKRQIYKARCHFMPTAVVVEEKPMFPEFSLEKITNDRWYYDNDEKTIYICLPNGLNPTSKNIGVIKDNEYENGLFLDHAQYITIYGLTVRYAGRHGISVLGNNNRIEKCNLKFNGKGGITIWSYGKTVSSNNEVIKNRIYYNMMRNWPRGRYKWGLWVAGAVSAGQNTKFIGNVVYKNGGEGLLAAGRQGSVVFRDNIVYDNWSVNIYIDSQPNCLIERNFIFCREPDLNELYNNGDTNPRDSRNLRRLRAEGIMTADETNPASFQNAIIINNIILGCRRGITHYAKAADSGLKNVLVANNTIILPEKQGMDENYIGIRIPYNNGNNDNAVYRDNVVYGSNPSTYLLSVDTGQDLNDQFHGLTFDHNLWYHTKNPTPFHLGPSWKDSYDISYKVWAMKAKLAGQEQGSMFCDPKLANVKEFSADAVKLLADSPAINKGLPIKEVTTDYFGNPRNNAPCIGAVEFIGKN
jgi:hypothetical protein